jgi:CRISPR-associated endonuclease/helicase Cas3
MSRRALTTFQVKAQEVLKQGKSLLLLAPTGLGKTLASTADIEEKFTKTIYAVPLRALGVGIRDAISELRRSGKPIEAVIHHGDSQESLLFSEEVIVTTYDQVVCGVPGLPLSLPLKAGHAVAAALLMSRLILDEAHLAWAISREALSILLGIIDFRVRRFGLQTVVQTATLPKVVAQMICNEMGIELRIVGEGDVEKDEGLQLRNQNRHVSISLLELKAKKQDPEGKIDCRKLDERLIGARGKRIYFANTVSRLQETYDRLVCGGNGVNPNTVTVLHNRMPRTWRAGAEAQVLERFGKSSKEGNWLLLTNQVAEAGLDISAPLVISDPAPVDTLVQRSGRCARWFREGAVEGEFYVLGIATKQMTEWARPYRPQAVAATLKKLPDEEQLSWEAERKWVDEAWAIEVNSQGKLPKDSRERQREQIQQALGKVPFSLNLFDRAAQERNPGAIAREFREILSVDVAVSASELQDLRQRLASRLEPETSSVSFGQAQEMARRARSGCKAIRYDEGQLSVEPADSVRLGDILVLPASVAYLHADKGLCLVEKGASPPQGDGIVRESAWTVRPKKTEAQISYEGGKRQTLFEHVTGVVEGVRKRLSAGNSAYRGVLVKVLESLEPATDPQRLADTIAQISILGAAFHDLGKTDSRWQKIARELDPDAPEELIARTRDTKSRLKFPPHTPPGFAATLKACELLLGNLGPAANHLVRTIALAAARHHSSLTNPATVQCIFEPDPRAKDFVREILQHIGVPPNVTGRAEEIIQAASEKATRDVIPLALPNDDLFPIYAVVGRAILMADRSDAAGEELEQWQP